MLTHTRAVIAASAYAFIARKKVAGVHDPLHETGYADRCGSAAASICRGMMATAPFGSVAPRPNSTIPATRRFVSIEVDGTTAKGYDRHFIEATIR